MKIPSSNIGNFSSQKEAAVYQRANNQMQALQDVATCVRGLDQTSDDLDFSAQGKVRLQDAYLSDLSYLDVNGTYTFDPASGKSQDLNLRGHQLFDLCNKRMIIHEGATATTYKTACFGLVHQVVVDKASGDLDVKTSFLGIPLPA